MNVLAFTAGGWETGLPADPDWKGGVTASISNATGAAATCSVTGTVRGATPATPDVTVTLALYEPSASAPIDG